MNCIKLVGGMAETPTVSLLALPQVGGESWPKL